MFLTQFHICKYSNQLVFIFIAYIGKQFQLVKQTYIS